MIKPRALRNSEMIGVFAPGSPCDPLAFAKGVAEIEGRGYELKIPLDPTRFYGSKEHGFASASAVERANALLTLVKDPNVSAIIAARGAYGTAEILPLLDYDEFRRHPKILIGFSDVTVLLAVLFSQIGLVSFQGATVCGDCSRAADSEQARSNVDDLFRLISEPEHSFFVSCEQLRPGKATGRVIAGNLTMLLTLLGTPWDIDFDGAVLILEDVREAPYRVHRALTQLRMAGKLSSLAALIYGRFSGAESKGGLGMEEVLRRSTSDILSDTHYPVLMGLEFGHEGRSHPLPFGCLAEVSDGQFRLLESPVCRMN